MTTAMGMTEDEADRVRRACDVVGYSFVDPLHLLRALTHRSYVNENRTCVTHNEVLELLGDAVLSLVVIEGLVRDTADADEGSLTERRAAHVSAESLAKASSTCGLDRLLRMGRGVPLGQNLQADVVEAVIGAVYLDGGYAAARGVVLRLLGPPPQHVVVATAHAKRVLQERLQRLFGKAPEYVVTRVDGTPNHDPTYQATVRFAGHDLGTGLGKNKRTATEEAAADAVAALSVLDDVGVRERLL